MQLIPTKGCDIQEGNRVLIGDGRLDAIVRKVHPIGDNAIPDKVYLVWDTKGWRDSVNAIYNCDDILYVYPPRPRNCS